MWHGHDDRIRCDLSPHAPDTCSVALLTEVAKLATERDGCSPVSLLGQVGLLNERPIAAHCIHGNAEHISRFGAAHAAMAYTLIGDAKTGRIPPAHEIAGAGGIITLCTNTFSGDIIEAMRWVISMQRIKYSDADVSPRAALRWATEAGARALRLGDEISALELGKRADIVIINATAPTVAPIIDRHGILVYGANGSNVDTVRIDDRIVVSGGILQTADDPSIVREAQKTAECLWQAAGDTCCL